MAFFKHLKWGLEYAAYRGIEFLFNRLSLPQVHTFGTIIGRIAHRILPVRRRIVMRNLRIAFGDTHSLGELEILTHRVFERTGANLFCSLRTPALDESQLRKVLEVRNAEAVYKLIEEGRGIILLTPHMGNWELLAQLNVYLPEHVQLGTHYRPLNNPYVNKLVEAQRSQRGTRLFAKKDSPLAMSGFLRDGNILGILADQRAGAIGQCCPYYGRFTSCSPFPEILTRRAGAATVSLSLQSLAPGKWRCTFEHIPDTSTPATMSAMEHATRRSPGDVFWFQDRWRLDKGTPFSLPGKPYKGLDPATSQKPARLLVWLEPGEETLPPLPDDTRPDLTIELACPAGTTPPELDGREWDRVWTTDPSVTPEQLAPTLTRIDESSALPLDAIVTLGTIPALRKVSRQTGIPVTWFTS